jgi:hypothetical protein
MGCRASNQDWQTTCSQLKETPASASSSSEIADQGLAGSGDEGTPAAPLQPLAGGVLRLDGDDREVERLVRHEELLRPQTKRPRLAGDPRGRRQIPELSDALGRRGLTVENMVVGEKEARRHENARSVTREPPAVAADLDPRHGPRGDETAFEELDAGELARAEHPFQGIEVVRLAIHHRLGGVDLAQSLETACHSGGGIDDAPVRRPSRADRLQGTLRGPTPSFRLAPARLRGPDLSLDRALDLRHEIAPR